LGEEVGYPRNELGARVTNPGAANDDRSVVAPLHHPLDAELLDHPAAFAGAFDEDVGSRPLVPRRRFQGSPWT